MSWFYRQLLRPLLFTQEAEAVHNRTLRALAWAGHQPVTVEMLEAFFSAPSMPSEVFGLRFPNPLGLAAGMDKYAAALPVWAALGFGFTELGGVTWHAQSGNPLPRLFRIVTEEAIINRMGFNNPGAETLAATLAEWRARNSWPRHPVGINLGKSKITPLEKAAEDYASSFRVLRAHADFFVVNVSSPNTPNLRQLQDRAALDEIFAALGEVEATALKAGGGARKPILVKVAPDLGFEALDEILELVGPRQIAGIIATNTTISRPEIADENLRQRYAETGGLSGRPLRNRSTEVIRHLFGQTRGQLPIIGVGGIFDANDAWEKITAGACLLQLYTSLVYEGPAVVSLIVSGLREKMAVAGIRELREAVGAGK